MANRIKNSAKAFTGLLGRVQRQRQQPDDTLWYC